MERAAEILGGGVPGNLPLQGFHARGLRVFEMDYAKH